MPSVLDDLRLLLRPAGGGIHMVTSGREEQLRLQRQLYRVASDPQVEECWLRDLERAVRAKVIMLGVPCDTGAGLVRGQNLAPAAIRETLCARGASYLSSDDVVDVGDVRVVPHLLSDEMLSETTIASVRGALYGGKALPVSPLDITETVLCRLLAANSQLRVVLLGGDHSITWPAVLALARAVREPWAIVQLDAHTDLLPERLGIRINFASWAFHANDRLGRNGRLVQVGIRSSSKSREHWERELAVRQFWSDQVRALGTDGAIDEVARHLQGIGVRRVYVSNDIDGTDPEYAPATAAPEPDGLAPDLVLRLIERLGQTFDLIGGDVVEVAPPLADADGRRRTLDVAARYVEQTIAAALRGSRA